MNRKILSSLCLLLLSVWISVVAPIASVYADAGPVSEGMLPGTAPAGSIVEWFQREDSGHCGIFRRDMYEGELYLGVDGYFWHYNDEGALWTDFVSHRDEFLAAHPNCDEGYFPDPDLGGDNGNMNVVDEGSLPGTVPTGSTVEWFVDESAGNCGVFALEHHEGPFEFGGDGYWWQYDNREALASGHEQHRQAFFTDHPNCHDGI